VKTEPTANGIYRRNEKLRIEGILIAVSFN